MYITDIIRRSSRSIKAAKIRTLLTALAIAVGTFSLTLTLAASNGAQNFIDQVIQDNFDPSELIVARDERILGTEDNAREPIEYDPSFGDALSTAGASIQVKRVTADDIEQIRQLDSVERIRKDITVSLQYVTRDNDTKFVATVAPFNEYRNPAVLAGDINRPLGEGELLLPEDWLDSLGFDSADEAIGEQLTATLRPTIAQQQGSEQPQSENYRLEPDNDPVVSHSEFFTISAVLERQPTTQPGTELYMFISEADAVRLNNMSNEGTADYERYNVVYARIANGTDESNLIKAQDEIRELGYSTRSVQETQDFLNQIIAVLQGIVAAFGAIAIIASVFGIVNTMYISVLQRTREIGLLKSLGMRSRDVGRLFRFEAAWIGFLGGSIGSILAIALGYAINPWLSETLELGDGNYLLLFEVVQIIGLILLLIVISILAGWLPSRKAAKLDPIEALRTE